MFGLEKKELIFIFSLWLVLFLLMSFPYINAYQTAPPNFLFTGNFKNLADINNYYSFIKQAATGKILFKNLHTPENHRATFFNLEFLIIGKTASLTGMSIGASFHFWRVFGSLFLLVCFFLLSKEFFTDFYSRAWVLAFFSLGNSWAWLTVIFQVISGQPLKLPLYTYAGAHPFYQMFANPHFIWSNALNILGVFWFLKGLQTNKSVAFWISGGMIFLTGLFRPFGLIFFIGFVGIWGLISLLTKKLSRNDFLNYCYCLCLPFLALLYNFLFIKFDPVFKWYSIQSKSLTPGSGTIIFNFGLPLFLAVGGILFSIWKRKSSPKEHLLFLWFGLIIALVYSDNVLAYAYQFITLANPPLYLLAGFCLFPRGSESNSRRGLTEMLSNPKIKAAVLFFLLIASSLTSFLSLYEISRDAVTSNAYIQKDWVEAAEWVEKNTPIDAKLISGSASSNFLPRYTGRTVFAGYKFGVVNFDKKIKLLLKFMSWKDLNFNRDLLRKWQLDYVFVGWRNRPDSDIKASFLKKVYYNKSINIYQVKNDY